MAFLRRKSEPEPSPFKFRGNASEPQKTRPKDHPPHRCSPGRIFTAKGRDGKTYEHANCATCGAALY